MVGLHMIVDLRMTFRLVCSLVIPFWKMCILLPNYPWLDCDVSGFVHGNCDFSQLWKPGWFHGLGWKIGVSGQPKTSAIFGLSFVLQCNITLHYCTQMKLQLYTNFITIYSILILKRNLGHDFLRSVGCIK